jgi:hypothetical protein
MQTLVSSVAPVKGTRAKPILQRENDRSSSQVIVRGAEKLAKHRDEEEKRPKCILVPLSFVVGIPTL